MESIIYESTDHRFLVTPRNINLAYAQDGNKSCYVDINKIRKEHLSYISIVPDLRQAKIFTAMLDESWKSPDQAEAERKTATLAEFEKNYCIYLNGEIQINEHGYRPLKQCLESAPSYIKDIIITNIARQAATSHLAIATGRVNVL